MTKTSRIVLLAIVFVVAACGIVYELVAGALSSYILGDAVTQYSLVIGVFLSAMGCGSYMARFIKRDLLHTFINLEIALGITGGASSTFLFAVSAFASPIFPPVFYTVSIAIGIMIGIEIPLLVRIIKKDGNFTEALSDVLSLDYIGALVGSVLFPLVVLPLVGLSRASILFGLMNLAVAYAALHLVERKRRFAVLLRLVVSSVTLLVLLVFSTQLVTFFEDMLYQDEVIYTKTTRYQRLVLTRWKNDIRLYIDGNIQFSSIDEARYHESLVHPAMLSHSQPATILILGGGDGMAAREVLKYTGVIRIDLVDIDAEITRLALERKELVALNKGALKSEKVRIYNEDAMGYLQKNDAFYDVIFIDLPDPNSEGLSKLYSDSFYALCFRRLSAKGVIVTQATSPYYSKNAFWCINKTLSRAVKSGQTDVYTYPYHVNVPSFGEWGFVLASKQSIDFNNITINVETHFLSSEMIPGLFIFGKDLFAEKELEVNTLENIKLYDYYKTGWKQYNQ